MKVGLFFPGNCVDCNPDLISSGMVLFYCTLVAMKMQDPHGVEHTRWRQHQPEEVAVPLCVVKEDGAGFTLLGMWGEGSVLAVKACGCTRSANGGRSLMGQGRDRECGLELEL